MQQKSDMMASLHNITCRRRFATSPGPHSQPRLRDELRLVRPLTYGHSSSTCGASHQLAGRPADSVARAGSRSPRRDGRALAWTSDRGTALRRATRPSREREMAMWPLSLWLCLQLLLLSPVRAKEQQFFRSSDKFHE